MKSIVVDKVASVAQHNDLAPELRFAGRCEEREQQQNAQRCGASRRLIGSHLEIDLSVEPRDLPFGPAAPKRHRSTRRSHPSDSYLEPNVSRPTIRVYVLDPLLTLKRILEHEAPD